MNPQIADRQQIVGNVEISEVDSEVDRSQAKAVLAFDIGAGSNCRLSGTKVFTAHCVKELGGRRFKLSLALLGVAWRAG